MPSYNKIIMMGHLTRDPQLSTGEAMSANLERIRTPVNG